MKFVCVCVWGGGGSIWLYRKKITVMTPDLFLKGIMIVHEINGSYISSRRVYIKVVPFGITSFDE